MASDEDIRAAYRDVFGQEITDDWLATQRPVPLDRAGFTAAYQGWEDADIRAAYRDVFGEEITDDWLATQRPSNLGRTGFTAAYQGWEDAQNKNQYSIREFTTGAGGDAGYNTEYALVDPKGNRVADVRASQDDSGNVLGYYLDNSSGGGESDTIGTQTPIDLDAINARAAKGTVPFGTGMGPALGYAYGMKNSSGDIFRKFDAKGNLTEFLDEHGKFQPASSFQPTGMQFNASTGNFETTYKSPNSPRENISESSAATVNRYSPTSGGWLGAGGWGNIARLVVAGLTANPALMASIGISSSVASAIGNVAIGIADGKNFGEALLDGIKSGAISAATSGILQGINADGVDNIAANWEDAVNNGSFADAAVNFSDNYIAPVIDSGGTFTGDAGITDSDMSFADLLDAVGISSDQGAAGLDTATEIGTKVGDIATTGGDQVTQTDTNTTGNTVADVIADTGTTVEDAITGTTTGNVEDVIADSTTGTTDTVGTADTTTGSTTDTTGTNTTTGDTGTTIEDVIENTDETTEAQADEVDPIATPLIQQLRADIERYEAAGMERDEALNQAIKDLAAQTGQDKQDIIAQIAAGDAALYEQFQGFQQDVANSIENLASELGLTKQEILDKLAAGDQAVMDALGVTEQNLTDYITSIQQDLGGQITDLGTDLGGQITEVRDELTGEIIGVRDELTGKITDVETNLGGQITDVGTQVTDLTTDFNAFDEWSKQQEDNRQKKERGKEAIGLLSQMASGSVKTPEVAKIDYMFDIGGDSLFATPKQESLMPSPYEEQPDAVEGAMPRYQYYAPGGGYTYAGGGMVAFDEGGDVTQEELEAALRPVTYNSRIAASGETSRRNKEEALARREQGPEDSVVDEYGNVIRFSDYGRPAPTLEESVQQLTGMEPGVERSTFLPYSKEAGVHVPEIIYGGIKSVLSPEQARTYGNVTGKEGVETALNVMGGGLGVSAGMKNPTGSGGTDLGMFIGPYSKMWDKKSYERALNLEKMGRSPEEIQALTGNIKSPSGNWSQMISDKNAITRPSQMPSIYDVRDVGGNYVRVKDVLKHHDLFKAYPDMAELPVVLTPGHGAYFDPINGVIGLGDKSLRPKEIKENILHELQHAIQRYEGWPRGGNTDEFKAEMINTNSPLRSNPLGKQVAELYDLFVTDPIAMRKYKRLEGEAQARATEKMMESGATQQRVTPISKQYDVPMGKMQAKYGYADGGFIEDEYTIEDLYRMLGSK